VKRAAWTPGGIGLEEAEPGPLEPGWVRLSVESCGICGTDLHLLRDDRMRLPGITPGHEIVGHPVDGPSGLAEGRYAVEPRAWCGTCEFCAGGERHLCPAGRILGITAQGGLAEQIDVPLGSLHAVPGDVEPLVATLAEPLAVCLRSVHLAELQADSRVLVLGSGTIGLLAGLLARDRAQEVALVGRHPQQRAAARALGLTAVDESEAVAWALDRGPDVVIETVGGHADTVGDAIRYARPRGRVVVLGVFSEPRPVDLLQLMAKELRVLGSNTYGTTQRGSEFGAAVALMPRYASELAPLQTHQFPLTHIQDAFATAEDKKSGAIKVTLTIAG
jgi:threonine dehydrogenase-like Zn-dependent dehydrogenase